MAAQPGLEASQGRQLRGARPARGTDRGADPRGLAREEPGAGGVQDDRGAAGVPILGELRAACG